MVKKNILKVKREGDFSYPIYFENSFDGLADALKAEGLDSRTVSVSYTHLDVYKRQVYDFQRDPLSDL